MEDQVQFSEKEFEAVRQIRNFLVHRGRPPSVRELMQALEYKSPRSAQDILLHLAKKGIIRKLGGGDYKLVMDPDLGSGNAQTVNLPLVGCAPCGGPVLAEENIEGYLPVATSLARGHNQYFLLRTTGDSMNQTGIDDGDIVLVHHSTSLVY